MLSNVVTVALEGDSDRGVVERLLLHVDLVLGDVHNQGGKVKLDQKLPAYNNAAQFARWFVLRDLDHDASCAPEMANRLLPHPAVNMRFRLAVRAVEAWLLADHKGIAKFLRVIPEHIPADPESLPDPKRSLVDLARRSRDRGIREDMVPAEGTSARVGPGYVSRIIEFAHREWDPEAAATRSDSLRRCIAALREWTSVTAISSPVAKITVPRSDVERTSARRATPKVQKRSSPLPRRKR